MRVVPNDEQIDGAEHEFGIPVGSSAEIDEGDLVSILSVTHEVTLRSLGPDSSCRLAEIAGRRTMPELCNRLSLLAAVMLASCTGDTQEFPGDVPEPAGFTIREAPAAFTEVGDSVAPATDIEALIAPYRAQLEEQLAEVLGYATGDFFKDDPEGALDNLVADALLHMARQWSRDTVHVALINEGGLRVPVAEGPIVMRHAYELLPFENFVTVLSLSGAQLERLADEIAFAGGEPIAGWTMELDSEDAIDVRVGGDPIDPDRVYRLATVDYLVNGGGTWSVLWEAEEGSREDLDVLIRDAFVAYLQEVGAVTPTLDGRIRPAGGANKEDDR